MQERKVNLRVQSSVPIRSALVEVRKLATHGQGASVRLKCDGTAWMIIVAILIVAVSLDEPSGIAEDQEENRDDEVHLAR